jgi:hypothetical protein
MPSKKHTHTFFFKEDLTEKQYGFHSIRGQFLWDLWWAEYTQGQVFLPGAAVSPVSFHQCATHIFNSFTSDAI